MSGSSKDSASGMGGSEKKIAVYRVKAVVRGNTNDTTLDSAGGSM